MRYSGTGSELVFRIHELKEQATELVAQDKLDDQGTKLQIQRCIFNRVSSTGYSDCDRT